MEAAMPPPMTTMEVILISGVFMVFRNVGMSPTEVAPVRAEVAMVFMLRAAGAAVTCYQCE
tara:strand:+ start:6954 stop:7136 length:183 start_codon:yes stop_codon:yes gene_type:complete